MELLSHLIVSRLRGAGLADSRLTSPQDPSALLREVPLPLSFCGVPPRIHTQKAVFRGENIFMIDSINLVMLLNTF